MISKRNLASNRDKLVDRTDRLPATLVLGAGVSMARGVPNWPSLVDAIRMKAGLEPVLESEKHPLALQISLDEVDARLRGKFAKTSRNPVNAAHKQLCSWLRAELYGKRSSGSGKDSLSCLAEIVRADQRFCLRRIARVVTFNADDLLEKSANAGHHAVNEPVVWPIARASSHNRVKRGAHGNPCIPVYHLHGYLPEIPTKSKTAHRDASDTLVFTDLQYWTSVASPGSFANRVMMGALHDSHCIFIGLSMTDMNLMRWLGVRAGEITRDKVSQHLIGSLASLKTTHVTRALDRHFWVRDARSDGTGLISSHLARRGVRSVEIKNWGADFRKLMRQCFPAPKR